MSGLIMPGCRIQIALTGTVWNPSNWVDIAPFVRGFDVTRGRSNELQQTVAGQLSLDLINTDGRFNPWSTNSPYYNQLSATDSSFETGVGTWTGTHCTLAASSTFALYGTQSLKVTFSGTSAPTAATSHSAYPVTVGRTYAFILSARAAGAYSASRLRIEWWTAGGSLISTSTSTTAVVSTSGWTQFQVRAVAPATAAFAQVRWVGGTTTATHVVYLDCAGMFDVTWVSRYAAVAQGWNVGQAKALDSTQAVRIFATWTSTTHPVFYGFIATWVPAWSPALGTMAVTAYDAMHLLALMPAVPSTYSTQVRTDGAGLQWRLNTKAGTRTAADSSGNSRSGTVTGTLTYGEVGGLAKTPGTSALFGLFGKITGTYAQSTAASIEFLMKFDGGLRAFTTTLVTFITWGSGTSALGLTIRRSGTAYKLAVRHGATVTTTTTLTTFSWCHFVITRSAGGKFTLYVNGVKVWTATGTVAKGTTVTMAGLKTQGTLTTPILYMQEVALYPSALSATQVKNHYNLFRTGITTALSGVMLKSILLASGVPSSAIGTIATGTVMCQPPSITLGQTQLLAVVQTLERTEGGIFYCAETGLIEFLTVRYIEGNANAVTSNATFASDTTPSHYRLAAPPTPALDDQTVWNFVPVSVQGSSTTYYAQTKTSQTNYGTRVLTGYTGMYFATVAQAQRLATYLLTHYATPLTRVRQITADSVATAGHNLPQMLGRKLLDAITVIWQPVDGTASPFTQTSQIQKINHTVTKTKWTTTWSLTPTTSWFVLNHSTFGVLAGAGSSAANRLGI